MKEATPSVASRTVAVPRPQHARDASRDLERLGMGMKRLALGGTPTPLSASAKRAAEDESTYAREKFGTQKAISSDMYFGRGAYDAAAQEEAQGWLKQFAGRTGIGSDEYFGREEE